MPKGYLVELAVKAKAAVNIPILAGGRMNDPDIAETAIRYGKIDAVVMGCAALADPEYPNKVLTGHPETIRPSMIDKISAPVVIEKINNILEHNPGLLEEWQTIALSDILGGALTKEDKHIPINGEKLLQGLLYHNQESRDIGCKE